MELKTYIDFKRQFADIQASAATTQDNCGVQRKQVDDIRKHNTAKKRKSAIFEGGGGIVDNIVCNSDRSSKKRTKNSDRLSPMSSPMNRTNKNIDANIRNSSDISTSNNSDNSNSGDDQYQSIVNNNNNNNNNVPFAAKSWWKNGNLRELIDNTGGTNSGTSGHNIHTSMKGNPDEQMSMNSNAERITRSSHPPFLSSNNAESRMIGNSSRGAVSVVPHFSSAASADQKSSSWLQLLGEAASPGGNQHRGVHHPQHQSLQNQGLQAMNAANHNNALQNYNRNGLLGFSPQGPYSTSLHNNSFSRMPLQSRLQAGNVLDPSLFSSEGTNTSSLQLQQQLQQQNFQSLYQSGYPQSRTPFLSRQNSFPQQRQNHNQRQQVQRPEIARAEMKIDAIRTAGDIGDASRLPAVERDLEESYQQDASFDITSCSDIIGQKRKDSIEIMDVNDLVFSDIVPMMPTSGSQSLKVEGLNSDLDAGVDIDADAHQQPSRSSTSSTYQSKSTPSPKSDSRKKAVKFRAYQAENWTEKFEELLRFREENGHCLVPNCHPENPALAQWTKRQRYQYKLKQDGKRSTITNERVRALDEVGFVWDSQKAVWSERLEELKEFKKQHRHCNVPSRYTPNHQLAIWVKRQRRQWKNKIDHLPNCMTDERQRALEAIGFVWDMKKGKKTPLNSLNKEQIVKK